MRKITSKIVAGLLAAAIMLPVPAFAEIIMSTASEDALPMNWGACDRNPSAIPFTPSVSGTISSTTILYGINNFSSHNHTDDITIGFAPNNAGSPGATTTDERVTPQDGNPKKYLNFQFSPTQSVTAGTMYWIVYSRSGACSAASYYDTYGNSATNLAGFTPPRKANSGVWSDETGGTMKFMLEVVEAPAAVPLIPPQVIVMGEM